MSNSMPSSLDNSTIDNQKTNSVPSSPNNAKPYVGGSFCPQDNTERVKLFSEIECKKYVKDDMWDKNLYNLEPNEIILLLVVLHSIGSIIYNGIFLKDLLAKINPLPKFDSKFKSEYFIQEVLDYVNEDLVRTEEFIKDMIKNWDSICVPFILETSASVKSTHYARTTKKNFGYIH